MLLNCKQCHKNVNEWCLHFNVYMSLICLLSLSDLKIISVRGGGAGGAEAPPVGKK